MILLSYLLLSSTGIYSRIERLIRTKSENKLSRDMCVMRASARLQMQNTTYLSLIFDLCSIGTVSLSGSDLEDPLGFPMQSYFSTYENSL